MLQHLEFTLSQEQQIKIFFLNLENRGICESDWEKWPLLGLIAIYFHREKNTKEEWRDNGNKIQPAQTKIENFTYQSRQQDQAGAAGKTEISACETPRPSARGHYRHTPANPIQPHLPFFWYRWTGKTLKTNKMTAPGYNSSEGQLWVAEDQRKKKEGLIVNRDPCLGPKYLKLRAETWHGLVPPQLLAPISFWMRGLWRVPLMLSLMALVLIDLQTKKCQSVWTFTNSRFLLTIAFMVLWYAWVSVRFLRQPDKVF